MPSKPPTVYLHIGTPKSGTTYLQQRIGANREAVAGQGLLWPGRDWSAHVRATRELKSLGVGEALGTSGPWGRLVAEVREWDGAGALISMERMVTLAPHQIEAAVSSLAPAPVEVICTARDLLRTFIAQAQEMSKNYRTWPWAQIVEEVRADSGGEASRQFWRQQDLPGILGRWSEIVPADRIHLVTVPAAGAGPDVLWDRFCSVVGIDGAGFAEPPTANQSLGVVSTVLLQRINVVASAREVLPKVYEDAIMRGVGLGVLAGRRDREAPITIDEETAGFLRERSGSQLRVLRQLGVDLVGSWDDLVPGGTPVGRRPEDVSDTELLEACVDVLATIIESEAGTGEGGPDGARRRAGSRRPLPRGRGRR